MPKILCQSSKNFLIKTAHLQLALIAGPDCGLDRWTGLLNWILKKDVRLACKTACVVETSALQGQLDVAEPQKRGARFT